jgi:hypothetical protein
MQVEHSSALRSLVHCARPYISFGPEYGVLLMEMRNGKAPGFNLSIEKKIPEVTDKRVYRIYRKISRSKIKQNNT